MALNKGGTVLLFGSLSSRLHTSQPLPISAVIFQVVGEIWCCSSLVLLGLTHGVSMCCYYC